MKILILLNNGNNKDVSRSVCYNSKLGTDDYLDEIYYLLCKKQNAMTTEIKNAIIESAVIDTGDRGLLTAWLFLNYGGSNQGFGGYALYLPKDFKHFTDKGDFAGHFIFRCMEIAGVTSWDNMKGKTVRVKASFGGVEAIGHIVNEDWFCPEKDFNSMREGREQ